MIRIPIQNAETDPVFTQHGSEQTRLATRFHQLALARSVNCQRARARRVVGNPF
jgi:hypothetical protein